ncbi:MAG: bifunctional histidine phosphatase family protein/GNAT family N-acetyltransferase [Oscillospiraceae bacterium]|nr:bifunctional histidine phosphatase family protein/GNAT family N-acetyltransferase [Oscillospiraceae bacterium]
MNEFKLTKIYLIRHAEAEGNIYRRAHGHYNGLITGRGYLQIKQLRDRFKNEQIDHIYSSDLSRTCITATAISEPRSMDISTTADLREVSMGEWEDKAWGDIEHAYPDMSRNFERDPAKWSVEDSEPYENVQNRMYNFLTAAAEEHNGETIACFSHGFAIRSLMCRLFGIPSEETNTQKYCDNTAVAMLIYENGELKVEYHNDNSHLTDETSTFAHQRWWREGKKRISENLRYQPLSEVASESLLKIFRAKAGKRAYVDKQFAAHLGDEPIGILGLDTIREKQRNYGWMSYVHVVPQHRKRNYGVQLLGVAISVFRHLGREKLRIELPSGNPGVNFFLKYGFEVLDASDELCVMEKDIRNEFISP